MAIIELQRRQTEVGRIRLGQKVQTKSGKTAPARLETFRFTSPSRPLVDAIAGLYGGEAKPWSPPKGAPEWEVVTDAKSVPVVVPPQDIDSSQFYELWSAGGCARRCTGVRELITDQPCVCDPANRECKMHTRVNVMLRDVPGIGVWRLDTGGYYAAMELPGMVELLSRAQGMVQALLELRQRTVTRDGQTKHFVVPVLHVEDFTPGQLISGQAVGKAIIAAPQPAAIGAAPAGADYVALANEARDPDAIRALWQQARQAGALTEALAAHLTQRAADLAPVADEDPPRGDEPAEEAPDAEAPSWEQRIDTAPTVDDLRGVWRDMKAAGLDDRSLNRRWWDRKKALGGSTPADAQPAEQAETEPDPDATWMAVLAAAGPLGWDTPKVQAKFWEHTGKAVTDANGWDLAGFRQAMTSGAVK